MTILLSALSDTLHDVTLNAYTSLGQNEVPLTGNKKSVAFLISFLL